MLKPLCAKFFYLSITLASGANAFESNAQESLRHKAELRAALRAQNLVVQHNVQNAVPPTARQLTAQERVNLRQQIRQQRL
jgi:hypothetical protein